VPGLASDGSGAGPDSDCEGFVEYQIAPGSLREVVVHNGVAINAIEFKNPCPAAIAPQPMDAKVAAGGRSFDVTLNPVPSVVAPGGIGFYLLAGPEAQFRGGAIQVTPIPINLAWDELQDAARLLTVDANGNNVNSPDFDPGSVAQFGSTHRWSVVARTQGPPPAWPPYLWLHGTCADGTLGIGRFFPDGYGYNTGATTFDGFTSWLGCKPNWPSITGPHIDEGWLEAVVGAQPNTVFLDDLTLEQTTPSAFRLVANVINTNTVPGRPATYSFVLNQSAGAPFQFTVPGSEIWFPGAQGSIVINNIPGDIDDFTSASGQVSGTVPVPNHPLPGWALPPTFIWSDGTASGPYAALVTVPNIDAMRAALGAGSFTYRHWVTRGDSVYFLSSEGPFLFAGLPPAFAEQFSLESAGAPFPDEDVFEEELRRRLASVATTSVGF